MRSTQIKVYDSLVSTQGEALAYLRSGELGPCWIQALEQTKGMGRRGRTWESLKGNLMASWYGVLNIAMADAPPLAFVAALSVTDLLKPHVKEPHALRIKWPNDILYKGQKLCGILVQTETLIDQNGLGVVVGIGLNLNKTPVLDNACATALNEVILTPTSLDPVAWLQPLAVAFDQRLAQFLSQGFGALMNDWRHTAYGLGAHITCDLGLGRVLTGVMTGITTSGAMILTDASGQQHEISHAEIRYMEPSCSS
jgi:BirA family transcriptional regulator, biotin operon repressor / biotin---[acetyl-CoA-carboxylase] ligase